MRILFQSCKYEQTMHDRADPLARNRLLRHIELQLNPRLPILDNHTMSVPQSRILALVKVSSSPTTLPNLSHPSPFPLLVLHQPQLTTGGTHSSKPPSSRKPSTPSACAPATRSSASACAALRWQPITRDESRLLKICKRRIGILMRIWKRGMTRRRIGLSMWRL